MEGYIAEIRLFAPNFAPKNWAYCSGQIMSIAQNSALYSLLGTTYGGDGITTFALPDLRGRVALGAGTGAGLKQVALGERAGNNTVTVSIANMPPHSHALAGVNIKVNGSPGDTSSPVGGVIAGSQASYAESFGNNQFLAHGSVSGSTDVAGSSQPMSIANPYLGMNYIICLYGIYPSRG